MEGESCNLELVPSNEKERRGVVLECGNKNTNAKHLTVGQIGVSDELLQNVAPKTNDDIGKSNNITQHSSMDCENVNENSGTFAESEPVLCSYDGDKQNDVCSSDSDDENEDESEDESEDERDDEKKFCNMSDLTFITDIVLKNQLLEQSRQKGRVSPFSSDDDCDGESDIISRASKILGKPLVPYDSDLSDSSESCESEESCDSDSSSSAASTSDRNDEDRKSLLKIIMEAEDEHVDSIHTSQPRTENEILPQELPAEPEVKDELPKDARLEPIGEIQSFVELMVVIKGIDDGAALDTGTVLFKKDRTPFGKVFDIFGPVKCPFYTVRLTNVEKFASLSLAVGDTVYFAPNFLTLTAYVFMEELKRMKGSDASWLHDQEPPAARLDFSDDEQEAKAKKLAKGKKRERADGGSADGEDGNQAVKMHAGGKEGSKGDFRNSDKSKHGQRTKAQSTSYDDYSPVGNRNTAAPFNGANNVAISFPYTPPSNQANIRRHAPRQPFPPGGIPGLDNSRAHFQGTHMPRTMFNLPSQGQAPFGSSASPSWVPPFMGDGFPPGIPCSSFQTGSPSQGYRLPLFDPTIPPPTLPPFAPPPPPPPGYVTRFTHS